MTSLALLSLGGTALLGAFGVYLAAVLAAMFWRNQLRARLKAAVDLEVALERDLFTMRHELAQLHRLATEMDSTPPQQFYGGQL